MNTLVAVVFTAVVAMVAASGYDGYGGYDNYNRHDDYGYSGRYGYGFARTPNGIVAAYNNAYRQQGVNRLAEHVGASSGTARYYGVPGTGRYFGRGYQGDYNGYGGY